MTKRFSGRGTFFQAMGGSFERCWAFGGKCGRPAIRAHSVQNARYLDLLERNGHVVEFKLDFSGSFPKGEFREKGRNRATTFTGLCGHHDSKIFRPIDTSPLDLESPEHLFLLAYRAVLREMHTSAEVGVKSQAIFQKHVEAGRAPRDQPSPLGIFATQRLLAAYETHVYQTILDKAYLASDFTALEHDIVVFEDVRPSIGASALFSFGTGATEDEIPRACLSVLPLSDIRTVAVFSYTNGDAEAMRLAMEGVLESSGYEQQLALSKILLNSCENFVLAPAFFDVWSGAKRERVSEYFMRTLFSDDLSVDDDGLLLFWEAS